LDNTVELTSIDLAATKQELENTKHTNRLKNSESTFNKKDSSEEQYEISTEQKNELAKIIVDNQLN
jgi:hypothetical protein